MKKLAFPLIAAALLAATLTASAVTPKPTNAITPINIKLTFISQVSNSFNEGFTTNITVLAGHKTTNVTPFFVLTGTKVAKAIVSKDIVQAIAPGVSSKAFLAEVSNTNGSYYAIRLGGTNYEIVTSIVESNITAVDVSSGTLKRYPNKVTETAGYSDTGLENLTFTSPTLSFSVEALRVSTFSGVSVVLDGETVPVPNTTITVLGTGTDSFGKNEIVTGTITAPALGSSFGD